MVEGKIGKSSSRLICFDFSELDEETKKTVAGELEQFALAQPNTLTVGTMQSEVKSDLITLYKLERI